MVSAYDEFDQELTAAFEDLLEEYFSPHPGAFQENKHPVSKESEEIDQQREQELIVRFLETSCLCGQNCQQQFSREEIVDTRADFRLLTWDERNCFMLSQLRSCARSSEISYSARTQRHRERQKFAYRINADRSVCRDVFLFYHGETPKRLKRLQKHLAEVGTIPLVHGNVGRKPVHACSSLDRDAITTFIVNFAATHGLLDPGRDVRKGPGRLTILLPTVMNYMSVHRIYQKSVYLQEKEAVSTRTFMRIWHEEARHIVFNDPRSDLCMTCEVFKKTLNSLSAHLHEGRELEKERVHQEALAHIMYAKKERTYYRACAKVSRDHYVKLPVSKKIAPCQPNSQDIVMHYSWDFAQQFHYPYEDQQVGPIYFKTPRRAQVFGVCCEAIPRQVNYLIDEADFLEKDANTVISLLDHFFAHHGLGEKCVYLTADNCVGQNKNNSVLQYLLYRVLTGLHDRIELSFLVVGHTKFSPDGYFGLIRRRYRRSQIYTYDQLARLINASSHNGHNKCQRYRESDKLSPEIIYRDWSSWLSRYFKKLLGITSYQHFRIDSSTPGVIFAKDKADAEEKEYNLLRKAFPYSRKKLPKRLPHTIKPKGLSAERAWYLYNHIRCHIPEEEDKNMTCPRPKGVKP